MMASDVLRRVDDLARLNYAQEAERWRIRAIMNGGAEGIEAILAWDQGKGTSGRDRTDLGTDLPAVNMMASGVERLGQKLGNIPLLKIPYGPRDSDLARSKAEKRERIIRSWDHLAGLELQYPQIGRWLPGYGYYAWVIRSRLDQVTGQYYPHAELRDPFDTWPGYLGPSQQPSDIAFRRVVPLETLAHIFPRDDWGRLVEGVATSEARHYGTKRDRGWEGPRHGVAVIEYVCGDGYYVCLPEAEAILSYMPNPLDTGPPFVFAKRFSFDRLVTQYHHVIGLSAMLAKLNVLALIATEHSTFRETNIIGDLEGDEYERGLDAVNFFTPGTRIERPTGDNAIQAWQQIDRLERQLRIGAAYDEGSDSLAARGGFITGAGQRELRDPIETNIGEYKTVIRIATERLDTRRLEWEEKTEAAGRKRVFWIEGDRSTEETYDPGADIAGAWRTIRTFPFMSSWDDARKIVTGLQLLQGDIIDEIEFQDNLDGLEDGHKINIRIARKRARQALLGALNILASERDPAAMMALTQIMANPEDEEKILTKFFTPSEPQMTPEEEAMAQMAAAGMGGGLPSGPPPDVQTVLSRLTGGGQAEGGVQTVATSVG